MTSASDGDAGANGYGIHTGKIDTASQPPSAPLNPSIAADTVSVTALDRNKKNLPFNEHLHPVTDINKRIKANSNDVKVVKDKKNPSSVIAKGLGPNAKLEDCSTVNGNKNTSSTLEDPSTANGDKKMKTSQTNVMKSGSNAIKEDMPETSMKSTEQKEKLESKTLIKEGLPETSMKSTEQKEKPESKTLIKEGMSETSMKSTEQKEKLESKTLIKEGLPETSMKSPEQKEKLESKTLIKKDMSEASMKSTEQKEKLESKTLIKEGMPEKSMKCTEQKEKLESKTLIKEGMPETSMKSTEQKESSLRIRNLEDFGKTGSGQIEWKLKSQLTGNVNLNEKTADVLSNPDSASKKRRRCSGAYTISTPEKEKTHQSLRSKEANQDQPAPNLRALGLLPEAKCGVKRIEYYTGNEIPEEKLQMVIKVTKDNMQALYNENGRRSHLWTWDDDKKRKEVVNPDVGIFLLYGKERIAVKKNQKIDEFEGKPPNHSPLKITFKISRKGSKIVSSSADFDPKVESKSKTVPSEAKPECAQEDTFKQVIETIIGDIEQEHANKKQIVDSSTKTKNLGREMKEIEVLIGVAVFSFLCTYNIPHVYIQELQIKKQYRGRGIGSYMMEHIHHIARTTNQRMLLLTAFTNNPKAVNFYKKLGYSLDEASPGPCWNVTNSPHELLSLVIDDELRSHKCMEPGCTERFRFSESLIRHGCCSHGKAWPVVCTAENCGMGMVTKDQRRKHMKLMHDINYRKPKKSREKSDPGSGTKKKRKVRDADFILAMKLQKQETRRSARTNRGSTKNSDYEYYSPARKQYRKQEKSASANDSSSSIETFSSQEVEEVEKDKDKEENKSIIKKETDMGSENAVYSADSPDESYIRVENNRRSIECSMLKTHQIRLQLFRFQEKRDGRRGSALSGLRVIKAEDEQDDSDSDKDDREKEGAVENKKDTENNSKFPFKPSEQIALRRCIERTMQLRRRLDQIASKNSSSKKNKRQRGKSSSESGVIRAAKKHQKINGKKGRPKILLASEQCSAMEKITEITKKKLTSEMHRPLVSIEKRKVDQGGNGGSNAKAKDDRAKYNDTISAAENPSLKVSLKKDIETKPSASKHINQSSQNGGNKTHVNNVENHNRNRKSKNNVGDMGIEEVTDSDYLLALKLQRLEQRRSRRRRTAL